MHVFQVWATEWFADFAVGRALVQRKSTTGKEGGRQSSKVAQDLLVLYLAQKNAPVSGSLCRCCCRHGRL